VVLVEHFLSAFEVKIVLCVQSPRQGGHLLQVVELHAVFRTLRVEHVELVQFLVKGLGNFLGPLHVLGFFQQLMLLGRPLAASQFLFDVLHLLLQEIFFLLLIEVFAGFLVNLVSELLELNLPVFNLQQFDDSFLDVAVFQQPDLVFDRQWQVGAHEVGEHDWVGEVLDGHQNVIRNLLTALDQLFGRRAQILYQCHKLRVFVGRKLVGRGCHDTFIVGFDARDFLQPAFAERLEDGCHVVGSGHFDDSHQPGVDAIFIEFVAGGIVHVGIALAEYGANIVFGVLAEFLG